MYWSNYRRNNAAPVRDAGESCTESPSDGSLILSESGRSRGGDEMWRIPGTYPRTSVDILPMQNDPICVSLH